MLPPIADTSDKRGFALLERGFRPFFLLAGLGAVILIALWVASFRGFGVYPAYYSANIWHGHEMIFGYAAAVIAGFLLTAVQNWTGRPLPKGGPLAALALLWLAGRLLPFLAGSLPHWVIAATDLAFIPLLGLAIGIPLVQTNNRRNLFLIPALILFFTANMLVHLQAMGIQSQTAVIGENMGLGIVILLIAVIGGRVIPFFTRSAIPGYEVNVPQILNSLSMASIVAFVIAFAAIDNSGHLFSTIAFFAALVNAARLASWYTSGIWTVPLVWVIHIAYAWLAIGLALFGLEAVMPLLGKPALHALTMGTVGGMTLGMMARVALGHSGRPLVPAKATVIAFVLINAAVIVRVFLPLISPHRYADAILVSGIVWVCGFLTFTLVYARILTLARADGKPG